MTIKFWSTSNALDRKKIISASIVNSSIKIKIAIITKNN